MVLSPWSTRLIETRVFVVVLVFSAVSGLNSAFAPYLSFLLLRLGFPEVEIGFASILMSFLQFLISPILFFVVLYLTCGGLLLKRVASVLVSLVFGSFVGYPIGGFIGFVVVAVQLGLPGVLFLSLYSLPQHVVSQTLVGFAVLAFSDINLRWRAVLPVDELQQRRPWGVTLLAALYVVFALLNTVVAPLVALYPSITVSMRHGAFALVAVGVAFGLAAFGQLVAAAGLYYGRKWGWFAAVISSAASLVMDVYALGLTVATSGFPIAPVLIMGSFVGVIVSLVILLYLLSIGVRLFFGLVNPASQAPDESSRTEANQKLFSFSRGLLLRRLCSPKR